MYSTLSTQKLQILFLPLRFSLRIYLANSTGHPPSLSGFNSRPFAKRLIFLFKKRILFNLLLVIAALI